LCSDIWTLDYHCGSCSCYSGTDYTNIVAPASAVLTVSAF